MDGAYGTVFAYGEDVWGYGSAAPVPTSITEVWTIVTTTSTVELWVIVDTTSAVEAWAQVSVGSGQVWIKHS